MCDGTEEKRKSVYFKVCVCGSVCIYGISYALLLGVWTAGDSCLLASTEQGEEDLEIEN